MHERQAGFTLVELLIAIAIVGILAAVAIPSYRDYVRRGQIPDALASLSDYRIKLESYYQDYRSYGKGDGKCGGESTASWKDFVAPAGSKFSFECVTGDSAQRFTVRAKGLANTPVDGHQYSIDSNNTRKTEKFKGTTVDKSCWLVSGSEC
jgi:type IV pilus assembly protein PilE